MGNSPYVDYEVSSSKTWAAEEQFRYLPGMGTQADLAVESGTPGEPMYYHGDLIGSTMMLTGGDGQPVNTAAYTAFGEYIAPSGDIGGNLPSDFSRYGYAGAHGYESGMMTLQGANTDLPPITLQHVGERWYQPSLGRFIQRDPIGIEGGLNVYLYCEANPLVAVDPSGRELHHIPKSRKYTIVDTIFETGPGNKVLIYDVFKLQVFYEIYDDVGWADTAGALALYGATTAMMIEVGTGGLGTCIAAPLAAGSLALSLAALALPADKGVVGSYWTEPEGPPIKHRRGAPGAPSGKIRPF